MELLLIRGVCAPETVGRLTTTYSCGRVARAERTFVFNRPMEGEWVAHCRLSRDRFLLPRSHLFDDQSHLPRPTPTEEVVVSRSPTETWRPGSGIMRSPAQRV